jgi:hypothetical protein
LTFSTETAATPSSQDNANGLSAATQATAGEAASARRSSSQAAAGETAPASPPVKQAPAIADNNPTISIRRGPAATDAPVPQNVDAQLALPIQSLSMRAVPLATLIDSLADMSGVPMTIDPTALEIIGLSPRREVTLDVKSVTIEQALRTALASQRLDIAVRDGKVVVVGPAADAKRPRDYDVTDLAAGDVTKAALLAEQIQRFVAVESWEPSGGAGNISANGTTLHIEQADREHIRVLVFLERLRLARGLPLVSRYPAERLTNESTYGQLAGKLRRPTTFTYVPWTRLADVVRDWQRQSDVTMLVDWKRLAEVELEPSSPISCSVIHRTWEEALDGILEPLGLAWWAIDGETIQITSRKAADGLQRIEFFAIPLALREKYAGDEALIEAIRRELVERGQATVQVDIDGDRLIVLGNATAHRYLERRVGK